MNNATDLVPLRDWSLYTIFSILNTNDKSKLEKYVNEIRKIMYKTGRTRKQHPCPKNKCIYIYIYSVEKEES